MMCYPQDYETQAKYKYRCSGCGASSVTTSTSSTTQASASSDDADQWEDTGDSGGTNVGYLVKSASMCGEKGSLVGGDLPDANACADAVAKTGKKVFSFGFGPKKGECRAGNLDPGSLADNEWQEDVYTQLSNGKSCGREGKKLELGDEPQIESVSDCAALVEGSRLKAFQFGKWEKERNCYAVDPSITVDDAQIAEWKKNRADPSCPADGGWVTDRRYDFYFMDTATVRPCPADGGWTDDPNYDFYRIAEGDAWSRRV